ncbi:arylphorin subunit beta-like [Maniola hyperantus]|uniref:arylphorin subunit beta-like n=1 Tax=Aphantopus hyperantus TaxID=2795564 RepID=UPI00156A7161|nr:arylphorin subunit beta-like [Maniola hyperantus]
MKTVVVLACLAFAMVGASVVPPKTAYKTKPVEPEFVTKQQQILKLFYHPEQVNPEAEYYKIGKDYDIEKCIDDYSNKKAVQEFLELWKTGFMPKNVPFSIFYERQREEAVALFHVMFYAKTFDTFWKTAAFARVYINEGQFLYAYYIALLHRADTKGVVVPAPYEVYPELFTNSNVWYKIFRTKMQNGIFTPDFGFEHGVTQEGDRYVVYSNYSDYLTYHTDEYKISYFMEDIGLNAYYYYFHAYFPFWMDGELYPVMKERRGEVYYYFYQQLLARFYLERLSNGLGEVPDFAWWHPIRSGYSPYVNYFSSFVQRPANYPIPEKYDEELQLLDTYEKTFIQYLEQGHFKAFNQDVDLRNSKSVNFVGNFWQANADWHGKFGRRDNHNSYEVTARRILGAAPEPVDKYTFVPTALDFYQTSLRDPAFWQLYSKILKYFIEYKKFLTPYTQDNLHYVGVKINDVKVEKLSTFFEYYDFDVSNNVFYNQDELKTGKMPYFTVRQPRINHKSFNVEVDVKSDVEGDAVFKFFLGPKYDSKGYPISLEDNWQNFVELDWFVEKLQKGQNKIKRSSNDFFFYKEDSVPTYEILKHLPEGKIPTDMSIESGAFPKRLLLPKGHKGGFPYQLFVMVYPYSPAEKKFDSIKAFVWDNKPLGYPFDRPVHEVYFKQPNMFFEDVQVYHEGEEFSYKYNIPSYTAHYNDVAKH